jgi:hypothetical protein
MNTQLSITSLNNSYCQQIIDIILPIQQIEFNVPNTLKPSPTCLILKQTTTKPAAIFGVPATMSNL